MGSHLARKSRIYSAGGLVRQPFAFVFAVSVRAGCLRARRFAQDVRYRHKNGSTVIVTCQGRVIDWDDTGAPLRMIGTHTDVTKIRQQAKAETERKVNECVRFPRLAVRQRGREQ